jgi:hypothetical protein
MQTHTHIVQRAYTFKCRLNYIGMLLFFTKLLVVNGFGSAVGGGGGGGGVGGGGRLNAFNHSERKI